MKPAVLATALLAGVVAARSHGHKHVHVARDDNVVTITEDVYVTETTTVWVGASSNAPAPAVNTNAPAAALSATLSSAASSNQAAPVASTAAPSAPQQAHTQAQAMTSSSQPAPAPVPAPSSSAAPAPAPAPAPSSGGSTKPVSGGKSTHLSYNYFKGDTGACGQPIPDDSTMVAMSPQDLNNKANCGRKLSITGPGGTFTATAMDLCPGCTDGHIDIPQPFAVKIAGSEQDLTFHGTIPITWAWA